MKDNKLLIKKKLKIYSAVLLLAFSGHHTLKQNNIKLIEFVINIVFKNI